MMKSKEPSLLEFKYFLNFIHYKDWIEEKGSDIFIGDDDTDNIVLSSQIKLDNTTKCFIKIDKRYKEDKNNEKRHWNFCRFPHRRDYKYGWDINSSAGYLFLNVLFLVVNSMSLQKYIIHTLLK